jgi:simple sugar transport system permease protein
MTESSERRHAILREISYPLIAIAISFVVGALFVLFFGKNPLIAYRAMLSGSLGDGNKLGETLVTVTNLILTGLSVAFAFRCGLFNIGAEGQFIIGSVSALWAGLNFGYLPAPLHVGLCLLSGALAGGSWAALVGWLKAKLGAHEVVNSIMMNYIALNVSNYAIMNFFQEPNKAFSREIVVSARLWRLAEHFELFRYSRLHVGFFLALIMAGLAFYLLNKTVRGYEIRAVGFNPHAAEYGGISVARNIIIAMTISGLFAGLAGAIQTCGVQYRVNNLFGFTGYGFDGISVALVGNNHPLGVILSAFLFGILQKGGPMMQIEGIPKEVVGIIQGIIILFVAANFVRWFMTQREIKRLRRVATTPREME